MPEQSPKMKENKIKSAKDRNIKYNSLLFSFIFLQFKHTNIENLPVGRCKMKV